MTKSVTCMVHRMRGLHTVAHHTHSHVHVHMEIKQSTHRRTQDSWAIERQRHAVLSACLIRGRLSFLDARWREGRIDVSALRARGPGGRTPMFVACQTGNLDTAKWLFTNGCADQVKGSFDKESMSPMYIVCYQGHLKIARWLYKSGADRDLFSPDPSTGFLPLHAACLGGHRDVALWIRDVVHGRKNKDRVFTTLTSGGVTPMDICATLGYEDLANAFRIFASIERSEIPRLRGCGFNADGARVAGEMACLGMSVSLWKSGRG